VKTSTFPLCLTALGLLWLSGFLVSCGGSQSSTPAGPIPPANTTLQAETGNNTSTASSFAGQSNGNVRAGNVSKLPIASLLYSGVTTKIYVTWLSWFGQPNHPRRRLCF
jgi:hypothetical protein